jgi:hypothetical protein
VCVRRRCGPGRTGRYRRGDWSEIISEDTARIAELERENRELRRADEILCTASALFAAAEQPPKVPNPADRIRPVDFRDHRLVLGFAIWMTKRRPPTALQHPISATSAGAAVAGFVLLLARAVPLRDNVTGQQAAGLA